jgi:hypothetical protein
MTDKATIEGAPAPPDPQTKDDELTDQQLEGVAGAAGRQVQDCEGYTSMTKALLSSTTSAAKSE